MEDITKKEPEKLFAYNKREYKASDDIAFFSQELYLLKLESNLLGDYDRFGKYVLQNETLKMLSDVNKTIIKKENQQLYLKADCINYRFRFLLRIFELNKTQKAAQLFLVETLNDILNKDKEIVSLVSNYIDDNDVFFEEKCKKVFHIVADTEDGKKEKNEILLKALLEKLKFEKKMYQNYLLQNKQRDRIYVEKMLKLLETDATGKVVLKKHEALLAKYGAKINSKDKDYYRIIKKLLDEVLEEERKKLSVNLNMLVLRLRQSYVKANTLVIESVKTAVVAKSKEIEKEIKLGKGPGLPKFSYYRGVETKKSSKPKMAKKKSSAEPVIRQKKSDQKIMTESADSIKDLVSVYIKSSFVKDLHSKDEVQENIGKTNKAQQTFNYYEILEKKIGATNETQETIDYKEMLEEKVKETTRQKQREKAGQTLNEKARDEKKQQLDSRSVFGKFFES